jgi:hypothetical protein
MSLLLIQKSKLIRYFLKRTIINEENGCWLYQGYLDAKGYAIVGVEGNNYRLHRLSLYLHGNFNLKSKLQAAHKRECKFKHCWNPNHIYAADQCDNMQDLVKTGGHKEANKTHCPAGHQYSKENTSYCRGRRRCKGD